MSKTQKKGRGLTLGLGVLQVLIGLGAVAGGLGLIVDPTGASLGLPVEWLSGSPFPDHLIPDIVLLGVNGLESGRKPGDFRGLSTCRRDRCRIGCVFDPMDRRPGRMDWTLIRAPTAVFRLGRSRVGIGIAAAKGLA